MVMWWCLWSTRLYIGYSTDSYTSFPSLPIISDTTIMMISRSIEWTVVLHFNKFTVYWIGSYSTEVSSSILIHYKWLIHLFWKCIWLSKSRQSLRETVHKRYTLHYHELIQDRSPVYMPGWLDTGIPSCLFSYSLKIFQASDTGSLWGITDIDYS